MKKLEYAAGVADFWLTRQYLDLYESCPEHYRAEDCRYGAFAGIW